MTQDAQSKDGREHMRRALIMCAETFRFYAKQHRAKGTPDGNEKAVRNDDMATMCERAFSGVASPVGGTGGWWDTDIGAWVDGSTRGYDDELVTYEPTHWMPLPAPPVEGQDGTTERPPEPRESSKSLSSGLVERLSARLTRWVEISDGAFPISPANMREILDALLSAEAERDEARKLADERANKLNGCHWRVKYHAAEARLAAMGERGGIADQLRALGYQKVFNAIAESVSISKEARKLGFAIGISVEKFTAALVSAVPQTEAGKSE